MPLQGPTRHPTRQRDRRVGAPGREVVRSWKREWADQAVRGRRWHAPGNGGPPPRALRNPDQLRAKGASIPGVGSLLPEVIAKQLTEFALGHPNPTPFAVVSPSRASSRPTSTGVTGSGTKNRPVPSGTARHTCGRKDAQKWSTASPISLGSPQVTSAMGG